MKGLCCSHLRPEELLPSTRTHYRFIDWFHHLFLLRLRRCFLRSIALVRRCCRSPSRLLIFIDTHFVVLTRFANVIQRAEKRKMKFYNSVSVKAIYLSIG